MFTGGVDQSNNLPQYQLYYPYAYNSQSYDNVNQGYTCYTQYNLYANQDFSSTDQNYNYANPYLVNSECSYPQKEKKIPKIGRNTLINYILIIAAVLFALAPAMTFSKVKIKTMSLKFNMYEIVSFSKTIENDRTSKEIIEFYVDNYKDISEIAKKAANVAGKISEITDNQNLISIILSYLPGIGTISSVAIDAINEIAINVQHVLTDLSRALRSNTNYQIIDTVNIGMNSRAKIWCLIIALPFLGIIGILLMIFDKKKWLLLVSVFGIGTFVLALTSFKHMFLSMGMGVYMILVATVVYIVCGVVSCRNKTYATN